VKEGTFHLEIITPDKRFLEQEVTFLILPEPDGEIGVLRNHIPLVASLDPGVLSYDDKSGKRFRVAIGGGFLKFERNHARILAETAEKADDIDLERARRARDRALERLRQRERDLNQPRAELALKRSLARIRAAEGSGR
jgi:F-type H+-transporting ATPase subunit epsilon